MRPVGNPTGVKFSGGWYYYTHFSLLKTVETALGLPCLNHACDASTAVMSDLFGLNGGRY